MVQDFLDIRLSGPEHATRSGVVVQEFRSLLDDNKTSHDFKETLLMTITVAGAATRSNNAQLLLLAILVGSLADTDATLRAAASELIESVTLPHLLPRCMR